MKYLRFAIRRIDMVNWIDSIIKFLFISSIFLFILGFLSFMVINTLKISGKARLWICSMLIIMPLAYPIQALLPTNISVQIPLEKGRSYHSQSFGSETGIIHDVSGNLSSRLSDMTATDKITPPTEKVPNTATSGASKPVADHISAYPVTWKMAITITWFAIFIFSMVRFIFLVRKSRLFIKSSEHVTDPEVLELLQQCAKETGLRRVPRILIIDQLAIPMAMGFINPAIIIPGRLLEPEYHEGLRFTILHELKHLHRHDNWWLLLESLVNAAYFFHPVIYWAKRKIHEEWEVICDRHVIRVTNKSACYADFLLHEIWNQGNEVKPALALSFISKTPKIKKRVYSILEKRRPTILTKIRDQFAVCLIFLSFIILLLCTVSPSAQIMGKGLQENKDKETNSIMLNSDAAYLIKKPYTYGLRRPVKEDNMKIMLMDDNGISSGNKFLTKGKDYSYNEDNGLITLKKTIPAEYISNLIYVDGTVKKDMPFFLHQEIRKGSVEVVLNEGCDNEKTLEEGAGFKVDYKNQTVDVIDPQFREEGTKVKLYWADINSLNGYSYGSECKFLSNQKTYDEDYFRQWESGPAIPVELPKAFGTIRLFLEKDLEVYIMNRDEPYHPRELKSGTDYSYDGRTGSINLLKGHEVDYKKKVLYVIGVPVNRNEFILHKAINKAFLKVYIEKKLLTEGDDYTVDSKTGLITIKGKEILNPESGYLVKYKDISYGKGSSLQ
jgi:beta-lactamase regulating signal transducer with metallopeptidase domain